jgi:hypothetical protein
MQFDYDFTLTALDGKPIIDEQNVELHAGRTLANFIIRQPDTTDALERWDWAQQLYKTSKIDLDKAGQEKFRNLLLTVPGMLLMMRGQLIEVLDKRQKEFQNKNTDHGKN